MNITKKLGWRVKIAILLILSALILYMIQYFIFHQPKSELFYFGIDLAFLPIEVLLVVLVIETAISQREKSALLEKLNMVIGVFFSEVGIELLSEISKFDSKSKKISNILIINSNWADIDFVKAKKDITNRKYHLEIHGNDGDSLEFLRDTKTFLKGKRRFLLALLENPNLLEHETFTELLRAVFHLAEEFEKRKDIYHLPNSDYNHLKLDTERAYNILIYEYIEYMEHLMNNYPYLFSLAMRTNPFDPEATIEIQDNNLK
jgi:hypothetical protein